MNIRNESSNFAAQNKDVEARQPKKQTIKNNKQSLFSSALLRGCSFLFHILHISYTSYTSYI